jgi:hypothetical protein
MAKIPSRKLSKNKKKIASRKFPKSQSKIASRGFAKGTAKKASRGFAKAPAKVKPAAKVLPDRPTDEKARQDRLAALRVQTNALKSASEL